MTADRLWVHMDGRRAGKVLRGDNGRLTFQYDAEYLIASSATALSPSLPLGLRVHEPSRTENFISGLLPERAETRERWARRFGTSTSTFDLISHMGLDCAGAVQFSPSSDPSEIARQARHVPISDEGIADRVRDLRGDESSWTAPHENWSLAGAQGKFALARFDDAWFEAQGSAATTHIVKPGISFLNHQASVEHVTMRAAETLGLRVAGTELENIGGDSVVIVRRYDRVISGTNTARVHQVDLCQALNRPPSRKYEQDRGPTAHEIADLIRRVSSQPSDDLARFSAALVFNYVAGCPDAHSKNYSLLMVRNSVRLAPLYDLATALPYDVPDRGLRTVAMAIAGRREFGSVDLNGWKSHARKLGLPAELVLEQVRDQTARVVGAFESAFESVSADLPGIKDIRERLMPALERNARASAEKAGVGTPGAATGRT